YSLLGDHFMLLSLPTRRSSDLGETTGYVYDDDLEEYNNPLPRWWLIKFYLLILFGFAYLALYPGLGNFAGLLGWSQTSEYDKEVAAAEERYAPLYRELAAIPIPDRKSVV